MAAIGIPHSFRVLRHRDYALVQLGNAVSNLGTWMQYVAIGWTLVNLTTWPFAVSMSFVAQFGPSLVLSPLSGVVADRFDRRHTVIAGNFFMALPPLAIGWMVSQGRITIPWLLVLAAVGGVGLSMTSPASSAVLPALVPATEVHQAVTFGATATNLARVVGPSVGGFAIAHWGLDWAFYANGRSYFAVVIAWFFVRPANTRPAVHESEPFLTRLVKGLRYAWSNRILRRLLILNAVVATFVFHAPLMPLFARQVLHGDAHTLTVLTTATGVGAVLGAFLAGELRDQHRRAFAVSFGALACPIAIGLFSTSRSLWPSSACLVLFGLGYFLFLATSQSMLIMMVADEFRGRVQGLLGMVSIGGVPLAAILAGWAGSWFSPTGAVSLGAGVMLAFGVWFVMTGGVRDITRVAAPSA